ncbi:hypothetical protein CGCF413_v000150 [Colletotrichum fructicola]|nr:hypothetical protein CGCF413_v000150 [Colletotrichum fructicola]
MQFSTLLVVLFAGIVVATPAVVERQQNTVTRLRLHGEPRRLNCPCAALSSPSVVCQRSGRSEAIKVNDSGDCRLVEGTPVDLACGDRAKSNPSSSRLGVRHRNGTTTADHEARRRGYRKSRAPTFRHGARSTNTRCLQQGSDSQQPSESKAPMTTKPLDHRYPRQRSGYWASTTRTQARVTLRVWKHQRSPSHAIHTQALHLLRLSRWMHSPLRLLPSRQTPAILAHLSERPQAISDLFQNQIP